MDSPSGVTPLGERRPAGQASSVDTDGDRLRLLIPFYKRLVAQMGVCSHEAAPVGGAAAMTMAPHDRMRKVLQGDPSMAALLPAGDGSLALGQADDAPFRVMGERLVVLPPLLLEDAAAMAAAARWGLEAARIQRWTLPGTGGLVAVLYHGAGLIGALQTSARDLLLQLIPGSIGAELWSDRGATPSDAALGWLAGLITGARVDGPASQAPHELDGPIEQLLVAGGDSRLSLDPATGRNRYGVPPRPRPEAVHFSSSTASAVSDYGFLLCELLRRDLSTAHRVHGIPIDELRSRAACTTGRAILALLALSPDEADVAIAASGTDTETFAVLVARAGAAGRRVVNLLIAPEESGSGVRLAGSGLYFDHLSAGGAQVEKGRPIWASDPIELREVTIRDDRGRPRPLADVDADFVRLGRDALAQGSHVLAHVLAASKTGLGAPSQEAVDALVALAPERVDVVVDACQMRSSFADLGVHVRRGRMLQVSGSKFLTGPPFSGALIVPAGLRGRSQALLSALCAAPEVGHPSDWVAPWAAGQQAHSARLPSFGPIFRWLPALAEAELLSALVQPMRRESFGRFCEAVARRIEVSPFLRPIQTGETGEGAADADFARLSIISFEVLGRRRDGALAPLDGAACRRLFELLNEDVSAAFPHGSESARALARQQAHIGQPVTLGLGPEAVTVLRMVLGARFFTIVGYAGKTAQEAALMSEISDAKRAIAKVELLAEHWWRIERLGESL